LFWCFFAIKLCNHVFFTYMVSFIHLLSCDFCLNLSERTKALLPDELLVDLIQT
jgi:hypothetical protein